MAKKKINKEKVVQAVQEKKIDPFDYLVNLEKEVEEKNVLIDQQKLINMGYVQGYKKCVEDFKLNGVEHV